MVFNKIVGVAKKVSGADSFINWQRSEFEKLKLLAGAQLLVAHKASYHNVKNIQETEFSVFSQWGDDGIIQYLIHTIDIRNKTFIEFGVQNYLEANTRFLLMNNNWEGLVIDGSEKNVDFIKNDTISCNYSINACARFITKENLNALIKENGFEGEIGILHIDVDGNDYWFWEELNVVNPEIVIMEYNSVLGNKYPITVPYKSNFYVTNEHYSNLYFGATLKALNHLAQKKGYTLVGSNSHGNNAYFVRNDRMAGLTPMSVEDAYVACKFRQNRDEKGVLTLKKDSEMIKQCGELSVVNVETGETCPLKTCL